MTWRAWSSDADGGVRTSILTAQTTPAPDLTRRVTPQNPRSQHYHHDFAEALTCHRRRGREAMNAAGILPAFTGIAVHLSLIHISEPTRRTPISYAVFCLKKKKKRLSLQI